MSVTPAFANFGREIRLPADLITGIPPDSPRSITDYANDLRNKINDIYELVRQSGPLMPEKMKTRYDRKMNNKGFDEGSLVWLHNPVRSKGKFPELQAKCNGPYRIMTSINNVTYRIQKGARDIALTDSPAGLLAYYFEKISVATRIYYRYMADGGLKNHFTREQLIDNLMMYWVPNSIATAGRIYAESNSLRYFSLQIYSIPSEVPTWIMQAKYEISYIPPWMYQLKYPNLLNETVLDTGGHFLALELPHVLAEDILQAMIEFQRWHEQHKVHIEL
ncbi:unnamed protein product [Parnassius mnemosyne]|uniref:Uncharacterized protein n=1 Tax=Parnassius mnemosyne TaxID=213953 RepID=A0AAV1L3K4_9NEOP